MNSDFCQWYERVYPRLAGRGRWLRGGEINTLPAEDYARRPFRLLIARLSTYEDTAESFTHSLLYATARHVTGVFPDMAYLPPAHDVPFFAQGGVPWLLGTQTKRGPRDFDLIGVSNSIVQELVNLPAMLAKSGVPLAKSERMKDPGVPLVILGGANALHSSVYWTDDPMVDGVFVGESPAAIARLLEICRDGKKKRDPKAGILKKLEAVPGFFQPEGKRKTRRLAAFPDKKDAFAPDWPVPFAGGRAGDGHLPISEGCPCFCSFCAESFGRKPYREYGVDQAVKRALAMKAAMGLEAVELHSFNFNMHSDFYRILWELAPRFASIGLKSQRMDFITRDPAILDFLNALGKSSLTCGIEGISDRLRQYLHKSLPEEVLGAGLKAILRAPIRELKIFLIATGLEREEDFEDGLRDLLEFMKLHVQYAAHRPRVIFSVTPLVRFPWTPLEFADAYPMEHMKPIVDHMKSLIRGHGFEFRLAAELPEYWLSQVLVRASDPRVGAALVQAAQETGFVYRDGVPEDFLGHFRANLREAGVNESSLLAGCVPEESSRKPWAAIQTGVRRKFLFEQFEEAQRFREGGYCLGRRGEPGECRRCGACPDSGHVEALTGSVQDRPYGLDAFRQRLAAARAEEVPVRLRVNLSRRAVGLERRFAGAAVARAIMLADPQAADGYRGFRGAFWDPDGKGCWVTGADVLTLAWNRQTAAGLRDRLKTTTFLKKVNADMDGWGTVAGVAGESAPACRLVVRSPFPFNPRAYADAHGLKFTLLHPGGDTYTMDFARESLRKKIVAGVEFRRWAEGSEVVVLAAEKFDVTGFLRSAFDLPHADEWVRINVESGEISP